MRTQTLSVLLNVSETSSAPVAGNTSFSGKEQYITLLGSLGRAVAAGAEAGENLDDVSAGPLGLKVNAGSTLTRCVLKQAVTHRGNK